MIRVSVIYYRELLWLFSYSSTIFWTGIAIRNVSEKLSSIFAGLAEISRSKNELPDFMTVTRNNTLSILSELIQIIWQQ